MFKKCFKKILFIFYLFIIIFNCSNVLAAGDFTMDSAAAWASKFIKDYNIGANVGDKLLDGGYFSEDCDWAQHFNDTYAKNNNLYLFDKDNSNKTRYPAKDNDPQSKGFHDILKEVVDELRNVEELKPLFKNLDKTNKKYNKADREFSEAAIDAIVQQIVWQEVEKIIESYEKGCTPSYKNRTFEYRGKKYGCEDYIKSERTAEGITFSYESFKQFLEKSLGKEVCEADLSATQSRKITDTIKKEVSDINKEITGSSSTSDKKEDKEENKKIIFPPYIYNPSYYPKITNAIEFANDIRNAGELEPLSGNDYKGGSIKNAINGFVSELSNNAVYILYGAILFFGVRAIWSGVNGKVEFKETLPYILLAIVLFYLAPKLVELLQKIFGNNYSENYLSNIWGSVVNIIQIAAFGGIVFTGIKLLFSSADSKADVKKNLIPILIGSILVFASSIVVSIVLNTAKDVGILSSTRINKDEKCEIIIEKV